MSNRKIRSLVIISNFFNHHQQPLADALYRELGDGYLFIETAPLSDERKNMGWGVSSLPPYVVSASALRENAAKYRDLVNQADAVIIGSAPESIIKARKKAGKLIFRYSERPLKKGIEPLKYFPRLCKWHFRNPFFKPIFMLCASAYTAADYKKFGLFQNRCFKWGYFTELKKYDDVDCLIANKAPASILWVSRMIPWKHPEVPLFVARRLKEEGYRFRLRMIGVGPLREQVRDYIDKNGLSDCVELLGSMKPEQVRAHMESSEIFLFTSDRNEGWGAVVNEAMNSACAVVTNNTIGSVPFLIKNEVNGLVCHSNAENEYYEKILLLLKDQDFRNNIAKSAYRTIASEWNAPCAAHRLLQCCEALLYAPDQSPFFEEGICSKAE